MIRKNTSTEPQHRSFSSNRRTPRVVMPVGDLLHCFACHQFAESQTDELKCATCGSDFVEVVEGTSEATLPHAPPPPNDPPDALPSEAPQPNAVPGIQGMLTSLLSSILPGPTTTLVNPAEERQGPSSAPTPDTPQQSAEQAAHDYVTRDSQPPFNDFFSQLFGQTQNQQQQNQQHNQQFNANQNSRHYSTHQGPGGSVFTFSFGTSNGPSFQHYNSGPSAGGSANMHQPFAQHFPFPFATGGPQGQASAQPGQNPIQINGMADLSALIAQALGQVPGTQYGDYASGEAFDNIISDLMNRNPQSNNVRPASDAAISQMQRITVSKNPESNGTNPTRNLIGEECSICQDNYEEGDVLVQLQCKHFYHDECLVSWVKTNGVCPICRSPVSETPEPGATTNGTSRTPDARGSTLASASSASRASHRDDPEASLIEQDELD